MAPRPRPSGPPGSYPVRACPEQPPARAPGSPQGSTPGGYSSGRSTAAVRLAKAPRVPLMLWFATTQVLFMSLRLALYGILSNARNASPALARSGPTVPQPRQRTLTPPSVGRAATFGGLWSQWTGGLPGASS